MGTGRWSASNVGSSVIADYVRPHVKSQKTNARDAEAITEAATRPTIRFVTLKSEA
jgi:hypothetical protein